jgi:hypothetical protein
MGAGGDGSYNPEGMIYRKKSKQHSLPGGYFHLESEKSKTRVNGFGYGDHIKLKDEYGNIWRGTAEKRDDDEVYYSFKASNGRTLTGVSNSFVVILRDDHGETWKGFID